MLRYFISRFGQSLFLLLIVSFIGFAVLNLAPGGPLSQFALSPGMTQAQIEKIEHQMGLDRPIVVQYVDWLSHMLSGDWGTSYRDGLSVLHVIGSHLFATLLLMVTATVLAVSTGSTIGIISAVRRGSVFDYAMTVFAMVALSIPTFWFGLVAIYIFSLQLEWLPAGNMYTVGDGSVLDYLHHLIMPATVLALVEIAVWSRYMRTSTLNVINQDFVRTARAKGLPPRRVLLKHVVGNSLVPMVTLAGLQLPVVLGGALVTETVFTWPGMGRLFLDSLGYSDYPVVMGLLMISAMMVLFGNLMADLVVALIDPRIRLV